MSDKKNKVSIIIPIYNASKYLEETINSILNQTYKNIEVILVNDASPDSKDDEICKKYVKKDNRVKYWLLPENKGPGGARNFGFFHSTGDYILFFDSDDILINNGIELLVNTIKIKKADIIAFSGVTFYQKENKKFISGRVFYRNSDLIGRVVTGEMFLNSSVHTNSLWIPPWLNLFDRSFLNKIFRRFPFPEGIVHEDTPFMPIVFNMAERVFTTHFSPALHRLHKKSITGSKFDLKRVRDHIEALYYLYKYLYSLNVNHSDSLVLFFESLFNWFQRQLDQQSINLHTSNINKLHEMNEWLFSKILEGRQFENVNLIRLHGLLHIKGTFTNKTWYILGKLPILKVTIGNFFKCYSLPLLPFICIKRKIKHV